jgi:PAS domain-containing protein
MNMSMHGTSLPTPDVSQPVEPPVRQDGNTGGLGVAFTRNATGVWVLATVAILAVLLPFDQSIRVGVIAIGALVASGVVYAQSRARIRRIRGIEQAAHVLLTTEPGEHPELDASFSAVHHSRSGWAGSAAAVELEGLRRTLEELGVRISAELRDAAKNARNLAALIDAIDEPLLAFDDEDRVLLCNRSAETLLDAAPGSLNGRPIGELFTSEDILTMNAAARDSQIRRGRVRLITALGTRVMQVSACAT